MPVPDMSLSSLAANGHSCSEHHQQRRRGHRRGAPPPPAGAAEEGRLALAPLSPARRSWWPGRRTRVLAGLVVSSSAYSVDSGEENAHHPKHSRVDQRRGLLRQLVCAVVDAAEGGAGVAVRDESFSASLQVPRSKALRGQEVVDAIFVRVLSLDASTEDDMDVDGDAARAVATEDYMDVNGRPTPGARHRQEGSGCSCASSSSVTVVLPSPGAKRKRV